MPQQFKLATCLAVLVSLATSADAAPIRVTVVGRTLYYPAEPGSLVGDGIMAQATLPDEFLTEGYSLTWQRDRESMDGAHAGLTFIFDRLSEGGPAEGSPSVKLTAMLDGTIRINPAGGRPEGQLSTVGIETSLANWSESSDIPRSVIDAFLHPKSTSIRAYGAGGINGYIEAELTVDPTQVPEPATWLAWAVSGLGALVIQKQRRNKGSRRELTASR